MPRGCSPPYIRFKPTLSRVAAFAFGTKAETLAQLAPLVTQCAVPEFMYFTVSEWRTGPTAVQARIAGAFGASTVIVRSSATAEDGADQSGAGQFASIPHVPAADSRRVQAAIESVVESYQRVRTARNDGDHVLVQRMIGDVLMSGVLFTQDLNTGAPYYVINYDDESGRTDTVTAGGEYSNRTLYVHRGALSALRSRRFQVLVAAVMELETLIGSRSLDVEFAVDTALQVHLLQVRRIATPPSRNADVGARVDKAVRDTQAFVRSRFAPMPGVYGARSVFGQMPDWNPAEMIGRAPRPLAMSLYRHLITDRAWREARAEMGYSTPRGMPLMASLAGQPFIDARLSFHSFVPATLAPEIGNKLVDAWLDRLVANPHLHDKVEFDVAVTALAFDFEERVDAQFPNSLTRDERAAFGAALRTLTVPLVEGRRAGIAGQLAKIEALSSLREALPQPSGHGVPAARVAALLEDCIAFGTVPFSILARHAFIAQSLLRSLVARGVLTTGSVDALVRSVRTVAREFADDTRSVATGHMTRADFLRRYGHLRPGTYDILSLRYDQRTDLFAESATAPDPAGVDEFDWTKRQRSEIDTLLTAEGFALDAAGLLAYVRDAIAAREYAKFAFTRNLSDALEGIAVWGAHEGLSRDQLSYIEIGDLLDTQVRTEGNSAADHLRGLSDQGRAQHQTAIALRLPQLLHDEEGVHIIPFQVSEPNYITQKVVRGRVVRVGAHDRVPPDITDSIVLIESADPGFDWIFAHRIRGLVTKFGGANSHMAIRCAEFSLPAAIGCGEQIFDRIAKTRLVELDCAGAHIRPVAAQS